MRAALITEAAIPTRGRVTHVDGIGWLVTQPADRSVTVCDEELRRIARIGVPVTAQRFGASITDRHLAVVSLDELVVCDRQGTLLWRRAHTIERAGLPREPNCHLDRHGVLWLYLPTGDELVRAPRCPTTFYDNETTLRATRGALGFATSLAQRIFTSATATRASRRGSTRT